MRGLKGAGDPLLADPPANVGDGRVEPALEGLLSDDADVVQGPSGTMRLFKFGVEVVGDACWDAGRGTSSSGGVWSAGGMGSPRAAAMIWCSVHVSEKSSSPRQKGASFLSSCRLGHLVSTACLAA